MEENKIPMPKFHATELVTDALKNAELVLYYCSESGLDINKKNVETLTDAKRIFESNEWTREIEIDFWMAYKELTALIKPVNVDSLKASHETIIKNPNRFQRLIGKKRQDTLAYRTVRFYTIFGVLTMVLMLILHIYFSIGSIRLNRIQAGDERIKSIEAQLDEMELISENSINLNAQQKRDRLQNELYEVNTERESNIKLLKGWTEYVEKFFFLGKTQPTEQTVESIDENGLPAPPMAPEAALNENIEIIQNAQNYVLVIGLYILPLFYGLLGALTFVLRALSQQTHRMQFTKESNINYILRLILGTIAGLAVGVFWGDLKQQESFIIIRSLGPLIVAYVAGLTVEYIFSGIEKLVGSWFDKMVAKK
ncbi:MAG: hypothetical protein JXL97_15345 [Bacteroidales bacterium]|nr:hypothetical protein [Bacteroidales bacterium]